MSTAIVLPPPIITTITPPIITIPGTTIPVMIGLKKPGGFVSFLDHMEHVGVDVVREIIHLAPLAVVVAGAINPAWGVVAQVVVTGITAVGNAALNAGVNSPAANPYQKTADVLAGTWASVEAFLKSQGITYDLSTYNRYVAGITVVLNSIVAPLDSPAIPAPTPMTSGAQAALAAAIATLKAAGVKPLVPVSAP